MDLDSKSRVDIFDSIKACSWEDVLDAIEFLPENGSNLALHAACRMKPPLVVVEALLEMCPGAPKMKDQEGYFPLHHACSSNASSKVVKKLIEAYPAATRARTDHAEELPLHLACRTGACEGAIMAILTYHPEGSYLRDSKRMTPMDYAKVATDESVRKQVVQALERAPLLCAVSKAAQQRVESEIQSRMRATAEASTAHATEIAGRYQEELQKARKLADTLLERLEESAAAKQALKHEYESRIKRLEEKLEKEKEGSRHKLEAMDCSIAGFKDMIPSLRNSGSSPEDEKQYPTVDWDSEQLDSNKSTITGTNELEGLRADIKSIVNGLRNESLGVKKGSDSSNDALQLSELICDVERVVAKAVEHHGTLEVKNSIIETFRSRLHIHARAEEVLAIRAVKVQEQYHKAATELHAAEQERCNSRIEMADVKQALELSRRKLHIYEKRLKKLQTWTNTLAFSTATWTVDADWIQSKSPSERLLDTMVNESDGSKAADGKESESDTESEITITSTENKDTPPSSPSRESESSPLRTEEI